MRSREPSERSGTLQNVDDQESSGTDTDGQSADDTPKAGRFRIGAVVAIGAVVVFVGWLLVSRNQAPQPQSTPTPVSSVSPIAPAIVTPDQLRQVPQQLGHLVYWAGDIPGKSLELTLTEDQTVYVRYLPKGAQAGTADKAFLTVATYTRPDAYELVQKGASQPGAISAQDTGGALVAARGKTAKNAYFAFEGAPLLVEVFDPDPGKAFDEIQSGRIQPVG